MRRFIAALPLAAASVAFPADVTSTWIGGTGNWNVVGNWSRNGVPNNGGNNYFVIIDGVPRTSSNVSLTNLSPTISTLTIGGNDSLTIGNALVFNLAGGSLANDGLLTQNSGGGTTDFVLGSDATFSGAGVYRGSNTQANRLYGSNGTVRLTNNSSHTIAGSMTLGVNQLRLTNAGLVDNDTSGGMTIDFVDGAGINFNTGTLRSSGGALLTLQNWVVENAGGVIEAGAGSFVNLQSMTVKGGTIRDADGAGAGVVKNTNTLTLQDVTLDGPFLCPNATVTHVSGAMQFLDTLNVNSGGGTTDLILDTTPFIFSGGGELLFSNTQANRLFGINGSVELTVPSDFTLHGSCTLGVNQMRLINQSVIDADASGGMSIDLVDGAGINFNTGTLRSSGGALLTLLTWTVENAGGVIEAGAGSFVNLQSMTVKGGTIRDADGAGAGVVKNTNTLTLQDVTLDGPFLCPNATVTHVSGAMQFLDTLNVNSGGGTTDLIIDTTPFTFSGGGELLFSNTQANRLFGINGSVELTVPSDFTLHGSCTLGVNQMRLINQSVIDADASSGMTIDLVDGAGINFNTGTLRSSAGASLQLQNCVVENAGGVIEAGAGSFVNLQSMTVKGGTIRDADGAGAGVVKNINNITLQDVTFDGPFLCPNATVTHLQGTINFNSEFNISSGGGTTDLIIDTTPFTLSGGGQLVFSNTQANRMYGINGSVRIINALGNTIRGALTLGANQCGLTNNGAMIADGTSGMTIDITDALDFTNNGLFWIQNGNVSINPGPFINTGTLQVDAGRTLTRAGTVVQTSGLTSLNGTLTLNAAGSYELQGGQLGGSGSVIGGAVHNTGGTVAPGSSAGILTCAAGYTQASAGTFEVEIGGLTPGTQHDQLAVSGNAALAGTLSVSRLNGFLPDPSDEFTILTTTGARTGTFAAIESCDIVTVIYGANFVKIKISPSAGPGADINNDGVVNAADLAILLGAWGPCGECCFADLNGDAVVDASDLALLLGNWS